MLSKLLRKPPSYCHQARLVLSRWRRKIASFLPLPQLFSASAANDATDLPISIISPSQRFVHPHEVERLPLPASYRSLQRQYMLLASAFTIGMTLWIIWMLFSHCSLFPPLYHLYSQKWSSSSASSSSSSSSSLAWMDTREVSKITQHLEEIHTNTSSRLSVLEYGSGLSTMFLSSLSYISLYVSIEHDLTYCQTLRQEFSSKNIQGRIIALENKIPVTIYDNLHEGYKKNSNPKGLHVFCVPQNLPRTEEESWWSMCACCFSRCPSRLSQFRDYVNYPSIAFGEANPIEFDAVIVDGRARPQAAIASLSWLKQANSPDTKSRIFIHDWNRRSAYWAVRMWLEEIDRQQESTQPGGGGLWVAKPKSPLPSIQKSQLPDWWE